MPKFPPDCIERLRNAGLEVINRSYDELEDPEVNDYQGRLIVVHEHHRLWMFSHEKQWCIEYFGQSAGDFMTLFDTPEAAVDSALAFFARDERWKVWKILINTRITLCLLLYWKRLQQTALDGNGRPNHLGISSS